jgi:hypothetical protein
MATGNEKSYKNLEEVALRKAHVYEEIKRIKKMEEEKMTTLPPPEDYDIRIEQADFTDRCNEGQVRNVVRELKRAKILTVLLVVAAVAVLLWCYRALQEYGLLS